jgi:FkbM family methyltransferase
MLKKLIQIGACDGKDFAWESVIKNQEIECIFIEPNPKNMVVLKQNYAGRSNFHYENLAISSEKGKKILYVDNYDADHYKSGIGVTPHASFNLHHQHVHGHGLGRDEITSLEVECSTLEDIIKKYNWENEEIHYLFVDTEGHDCDILLSTNLSKFRINYIKFETVHSDGPFTKGEKYTKTVDHLLNHGYKYLTIELNDIVATKLP